MPKKDPREFFKKAAPQSLVKIEIVSKYFWSWATALKKQVRGRGDKLTFLDLYSGPGLYSEGGVHSTPLRVLESILREDDLRDIVATRFNDEVPEFCEDLAGAISGLPGIDTLRFQPVITNESVNQGMVNQYLRGRPGPTLLYLDPFGYKGLSLDLIWSVVQHFGSDCIFFFNYRRVNAGLPNPFLDEPIDALFSKAHADALRAKITSLSVDEREEAIIAEITAALKEKGGEYIQGFRFKSETGIRTSHLLIFVSKSAFALKLMKDIMAKESSALGSQVPSYEFNPTREKKVKAEQSQMSMMGDLFETAPDEIDDLGEALLRDFRGQILSFQEIHFAHHAGKRYIESNYRAALLRLEEKGRVNCSPGPNERQKGTLGKNVVITFP